MRHAGLNNRQTGLVLKGNCAYQANFLWVCHSDFPWNSELHSLKRSNAALPFSLWSLSQSQDASRFEVVG